MGAGGLQARTQSIPHPPSQKLFLHLRPPSRIGIELLWLRMRASSRSARRFYRVMGFAECGRFASYYRDADEPAILMAMDF